jgi:Flp pilus assembly protein TadD
MFRELGDPDGGRDLVEQACRITTEQEYAFWQALALCNQAWLTAATGDLDTAIAQVTLGLEILDATGSIANRAYFQSYVVEIRLARGEAQQALSDAERGLIMCREGLGPHFEPELLRLKGKALGALGHSTLSEDHFRAAQSLARVHGMRLFELRAVTDLAASAARRGCVQEAEALFASVSRNWPEGEDAPELARARGVWSGVKPALATL